MAELDSYRAQVSDPPRGGGYEEEARLRVNALGKVVLALGDVVMAPGQSACVVIRNKLDRALNIRQVEKMEVGINDEILGGASSISLDFYYGADLTGTTEPPTLDNTVYRIQADGQIVAVDDTEVEVRELVGFNPALPGNSNRFALLSAEVSYFASNQSTSITNADRKEVLSIPYTIGPSAELVLCLTNNLRIGQGVNVDVGITLSGYIK